MATQKVFRLAARNSFNDLQLLTEDVPAPGRRDVLIRVRAVAINFRDIAIATQRYPFPVKDRVVPCSDACGEIVEVGAGVCFGTNGTLKKGDTVVGTFDPSNLYGPQRDWSHGMGGPVDGVLRQYVVLPAESVVKVPEHAVGKLSAAQWASLVCTGVTAWNSLYGNVPLKPGQTVLFQGTGGVSITGLMLAKAAGAETIVTSSSDEKLALVKAKYGADHLINYKKTPDWASEALRLTGGRGVDHILETGGAGTIAQSVKAIAFGGVISVIGFLASISQDQMPDVAGLALSKGCVVRGINIGPTQMLEDVVTFVAKKGLQVPVGKTFGFTREDVIKAYEYQASGQHIGKVCILVD